jgi:DNA-binding response OmpR family regulator
LTVKEFKLLELLLRNPGEVISRDEFLDHVWGKDVFVTHRTVDTHISALRKKIEDNPEEPAYIVSVRGVGYKFNEDLTEP